MIKYVHHGRFWCEMIDVSYNTVEWYEVIGIEPTW